MSVLSKVLAIINQVKSAVLTIKSAHEDGRVEKKYSLITHQLSDQLDEMLVIYSDLKSNCYIKSAKEVFSNIELLTKFGPDDIACIGYIVGCSDTEKEYKLRAVTLD